MRQTFVLVGALALLVAQPLAADPTAPLSPGKPAGIKPAQADSLVSAYAPAVLLGALLAVTVGMNGSSISTGAALQSAVTTSNCCG